MVEVKTKVCSKCDELKVITEFYRKGKGYNSKCKKCDDTRRREAREAKRDKNKYRGRYLTETEAECFCCGQIKSIEDFWVRKGTGKITKGKLIPRSNCKICEYERFSNWRAENRDWVRAYDRKLHSNNLEKRRFKNTKYKIENKEKVLKGKKEHYRRNKDYYKTSARNYEAKKRGVEGNHGIKDIDVLFIEQLGRCVYCNKHLYNGFHVDHIIPLSRKELSPTNYPSNLQLLCANCNLEKNDKTHEEYLEWRKVKEKRELMLLLEHWRL